MRLAPKRALSRGVQRGDDDHDRRHRQEAERPRSSGAVAEHELEVLRHQEHHAEHRHEDEDHAAGAGAERGVAEEAHVEHRLVDAQLPEHEHGEHHEARPRTRASVAVLAHPCSGASISPYTSADDADDREHRADGVELALLGVASTSGRGSSRRSTPRAMIGTLTRNTEPYQKCPSSKPLPTGPIAPAAPVVAAQIAIALVRSSGGKTFTRIDSVDGMMNAAPTPMSAAAGDELPHLVRERGARCSADEEDDEPELERALAPEAVAERAGREQQSGEHERVRRRRTHCSCDSVAPRSRDERRERDVQARVADEDDEQAQAEHGEHPPPHADPAWARYPPQPGRP